MKIIRDNTIICRVKKHKVSVLVLGKRDNEHKKCMAKKTRANSKLFLNSRSKEFPLVSHVFF